MAKPDLKTYRDRMDKSVSALKEEFNGLRTGRANTTADSSFGAAALACGDCAARCARDASTNDGAGAAAHFLTDHVTQRATQATAQRLSGTRSLLLQLSAGAALGLVVLYGVAFAESPLAHNAAHDVRHVTVKPCH